MNRAAIAFTQHRDMLAITDPQWAEVKIVCQVHDELHLEVPSALADDAKVLLKHVMETTVELPGVKLTADPKIASNLADLK